MRRGGECYRPSPAHRRESPCHRYHPPTHGRRPLAVAAGAPLLLVPRDCLPDAVAAELDRVAPERLVVVGGEHAVPAGVESFAPCPRPREVAAFYYPWYATAERDGAWRHWEANAHVPPDDVAADFYPLRGAYSSSDPGVVDAHMADLFAAGVDTVASSRSDEPPVESRRPPAGHGHYGWVAASELTRPDPTDPA